MTELDCLLSQVDSARSQIIELEQALVRIPSVNTGSMPTGNETAVCEFVRDWLSKDGIEAEIIEAVPGRGKHPCQTRGSFFRGWLDVHVPHRCGPRGG